MSAGREPIETLLSALEVPDDCGQLPIHAAILGIGPPAVSSTTLLDRGSAWHPGGECLAKRAPPSRHERPLLFDVALVQGAHGVFQAVVGHKPRDAER